MSGFQSFGASGFQSAVASGFQTWITAPRCRPIADMQLLGSNDMSGFQSFGSSGFQSAVASGFQTWGGVAIPFAIGAVKETNVSEPKSLYYYKRPTDEAKWTKDISDASASIAITNDFVYVHAIDQPNTPSLQKFQRSSGFLLWQVGLPGEGGGGVCVDAQGNAYGYIGEFETHYGVDADGNIIFVSGLTSLGTIDFLGNSMVISREGRLYLTTFTDVSSEEVDELYEIDKSDGSVLNQVKIGGPAPNPEKHLGINEDGNLYVIVFYNVGTILEVRLFLFTPDLSLIWSVVLANPGTFNGVTRENVSVGPGGDCVVTYASNFAWRIARIDKSDGSRVWDIEAPYRTTGVSCHPSMPLVGLSTDDMDTPWFILSFADGSEQFTAADGFSGDSIRTFGISFPLAYGDTEDAP